LKTAKILGVAEYGEVAMYLKHSPPLSGTVNPEIRIGYCR
jgi:hypothetical protein